MKTEQTYRLDEMVRRLVPQGAKDDDIYRLKRRIQNWVTAGLVVPVTPKHEGRGFHRRFDHQELCKVAVLLELAKYRLSADIMESLARMFDRSHPKRKEEWDTWYSGFNPPHTSFGRLLEQAKQGKDAFIHIHWHEAEGPFPAESSIEWGDSLKLVPKAPSQIIVSLVPLIGDLG